MPALPNVPNVLRVSFQHTYGANVSAFVHDYFGWTGTAPTATDAGNIATSLNAAWGTNFQGLCGTQVSLVNVQVTDLTTPSSAQGANAVVRVGTRAGAALTANDCLLVDLKIARRYRGGKPRQYWPFGVVTDVLDPQHWTSAFTAAALTAYQGYIAAAGAITWPGGTIAGHKSVSYFQGFTVVTNPITGRARNVPKLRPTPLIDAVTANSINSRIATQRRRQHFSP